MGELTKIAAILFKNLSDALLTTASELSKLNDPLPLSQTEDKSPLLAPEKRKFITRDKYEKGQRVMVMFEGARTPTRCNILKRSDMNTYTVYSWRSPKSETWEVRADQILGLDPNR